MTLKEQPIFLGGENKELRDYYGEINGCQKCELGATRNRFVFGVGNPNADLMFIGEAPGKDEDEQGEPFVGRGGRKLDELFGLAGLDRSKIYIANILKCRPPGNRDPKADEIAHCTPYLKRQIELVKPKVIVALGRISAHWLLGIDTPMKGMRGQVYSYCGIDLCVIYHPAFLLRSPGFTESTLKDLEDVMALYQNKRSPDCEGRGV